MTSVKVTALNEQVKGKSNINKYIIIGIAAAFVLGLAYGATGGTLSFFNHSSPSMEPTGDLKIHIHPMLRLIIDGEGVPVPANIGIDPALHKSHDLDAYGIKNPPMSPLHTHDSTGIIHVESTEVRSYTIGELFDVWGIPYSETCFMDKCDDGTVVRMWINGKESNEFRQHILMDGESIEIIVTSNDQA